MRKKDEIKLDALSMIDDEIIEKNTQKRIKLMNKKRRPRWIIPSSVAAVIVVAVMVPILIFMFAKQVPIYEGMTVSNYKTDSTAENLVPENDRYRFDFLSNTNDGNGNNGNHYGHDKKPIDDIVEEDTSIGLEIPEQQMYYAKPSQDIYITVHISNPDSFEILSFTLNGKKYSSYMFENGSDMENLILKVNVGDEPGIREYTIDAIKYVDGTEIKDVIMQGSRTVKVGVYSSGIQPAVEISNEIIGINDISFKADLTDSYKLIERSGGKVFAGIYTEDGIVAYRELSEGENDLTFEGLETYTLYRYGVAAYYDSLNGGGMDIKVLYEKEFTTQSVVAPNNIQIDQTSISFGLEFSEIFESKKLTSLILYHGEDNVKEFDVSGNLEEKTFEATELLSNNAYKLVISYENNGEIETAEFILTTVAKAEPTFTIKSVTSDIFTISGSYEQTNVDDTIISYVVELYRGDELVKENADKEIVFDSLDYYTDYTVKITYTYDLNDGDGVHEKTIVQDVKTLPYIEVSRFAVSNSSVVSIGDTVYLMAEVENPDGISITEVVINGKRYAVSEASTTSRILIEVECDKALGGGEVDLAIDQIVAGDNNTTYRITMHDKKYVTLLINGVVEMLSFECINGNGEQVFWYSEDDEIYLKLTVDNPMGYELKQISLLGKIIDQEKITKISNSEYIVDRDFTNQLMSEHPGLSSNTTVEATFEETLLSKTYVLEGVCLKCVLYSNTIEISGKEDFINLLNGKYEPSVYYKLTTDIDLSGVELKSNCRFSGVLDGNGYSIKNILFVGQKDDQSFSGLFDSVTGAVYNLHFENAFVMATNSNFGLLANTVHGVIIGCSVDEDSAISIEGSSDTYSYVGGLVSENYGLIKNCTNYASINADAVGGIAGHSGGRIEKCANYGNVKGSKCGGIVYNSGIVERCANYGSVIGSEGAAGISYMNSTIYNCINYGRVSNDMTSDYIFGSAGISIFQCEAYYCANFGSLNNYNSAGIRQGAWNGAGGDVVIDSCLNATIKEWTHPITSVSDGWGNRLYTNNYTLSGSTTPPAVNSCSIEDLNSKEFYTQTLGWSEDIWDFSELDFENGKYPKLK